jgi:uncharacterized protein YbaR (Trm112 family)
MTLLQVLRCPVCKNTLIQNPDVLQCSRCHTNYPIMDGIPNLIPNGVDERIKKLTEAWNNLSFDYDTFIGRPRQNVSMRLTPHYWRSAPAGKWY